MARLQIDGSRVLDEILTCGKKIIFSEGGTSSTKTYSFVQALIIKSFQEQGKLTRIVRKTWPSLRDSVYKDFFDVLTGYNLYNPDNFSKVDKIYTLNDNQIQFLSLDDPQKKRGPRSDRTWFNEANEFDKEDYFQMAIRTREDIWLDYNPSDEYHWIYEEILSEGDNCHFIRSTYRDNPWLEEDVKRRIEKLKETDETYWKIYGLGERATNLAKIYNNWEIIDHFPTHITNWKIGIDFGMNNPTAVILVGVGEDEIYVDELLYRSHVLNSELISELKGLIPSKHIDLICDSAEPMRISEIHSAGLNAKPAFKGPNSVNDGIDFLKRKKIYITRRSTNVIKEIKSYKWREDKNGRVLDEPVKFNDHAMDAIRYAMYNGNKSDIAPRIWSLNL